MISHPFTGDLTGKTLEELGDAISKLGKQQQTMFRMGKMDVVNQINMLLASYRGEYQKRQAELWNKRHPGSMDKTIDIS